jgi:hypothetical protein
MNNKLGQLWNELWWPLLISYVGICLEDLSKNHENLSQDSRSLGGYVNSGCHGLIAYRASFLGRIFD